MVSPAAEAQEALEKAQQDATELPQASQAGGAIAPSVASESSIGTPATLGTATRPQEEEAAMEMQPRAPPTALPKPALRAAQPDQTGKVILKLLFKSVF